MDIASLPLAILRPLYPPFSTQWLEYINVSINILWLLANLPFLAIGILPIPFQVAMITAGLSGYPIMLFVLAALIARGLRYYGLAWLVYRFGYRVVNMWKRHALKTSLALGSAVLLLVLGMQGWRG